MNTFLKKISGDAIAVLLFLVIAFTYFMTPISQGLVLGGHDAMAAVGQGRENAEYVAATGEQTRWTNTLFSGMPTYQIAPAYESSCFCWASTYYCVPSISARGWRLWARSSGPSPRTSASLLRRGTFGK